MSGQTVLSAVGHADLYEHEDHNTDGYLQLPEGTGGEVIELPENVMEGAGRCIYRMVELGG